MFQHRFFSCLSAVRLVRRSLLTQLLLCLLMPICLTACQGFHRAHSTSATSTADLQQLLQLMSHRLQVAPKVAQSKWNSGKPIDDAAREQQILHAVGQQAAANAQDAALALSFFQSQFDAGKLWQRMLHAQWLAAQHAPFSPAPDLQREVRPVLDDLTPALLQSLKAVQAQLCDVSSQNWLQQQGVQLMDHQIPESVRIKAIEPLRCHPV